MFSGVEVDVSPRIEVSLAESMTSGELLPFEPLRADGATNCRFEEQEGRADLVLSNFLDYAISEKLQHSCQMAFCGKFRMAANEHDAFQCRRKSRESIGGVRHGNRGSSTVRDMPFAA